MAKNLTEAKLRNLATLMRLDVMKMLTNAGSGHAGGSLSAADIFTYLYFDYLKHDPTNLFWEDRDYFLVSNGHICPIWYTCLAHTGYFDISELTSLRKLGSKLQGHPWNMRTPGVFNSSGPLGHGIGQAIGVAIGLKLDGKKNKVICFASDGEQQEGAVWEAAMLAYKYKLDNLTVIIDVNNIQIDGRVEDIMPMGAPKATTQKGIAQKYKSFLWNVIEINGHKFDEIKKALDDKSVKKGKPRVIVAQTVAGRGVSEMENKFEYHDWRNEIDMGKKAIKDLERKIKKI